MSLKKTSEPTYTEGDVLADWLFFLCEELLSKRPSSESGARMAEKMLKYTDEAVLVLDKKISDMSNLIHNHSIWRESHVPK